MKMRRLTATLLLLAMLLVCLPMQTRAEEQEATLLPRTMEQLQSVTEVEDGVVAFDTFIDLIYLCADAQNNPDKQYVFIYARPNMAGLRISRDLNIPQNVIVGAVDNNGSLSNIYIDPGVTVALNGQMEAKRLGNEGTLYVSPIGALAVGSINTDRGELYIDGKVMLDSGYRSSIKGAENIHFGAAGVMVMNTTGNTEASLLTACEEAKAVNNGHWVYILNLSGPGFQFTSGSITVPSNCSIISEGSLYLGNADLVLEGYLDVSGQMIIDGDLIVQPGALVAIGAKVTVEGTLENYGEIAIVSGVDDFNGVLWVKNPQNYKDIQNADQGVVIVAAKEGAEYPSHALVDMDVNSFIVEYLQQEGKSYWILTGYQYAPSTKPELPPEATLIDSGDWDYEGGNTHWELYGDGTLKITGRRYMKKAYNESYPWKIYAYMIKRVEISGIEIVEEEAFSDLPLLTSISLGNGMVRLNRRVFANCPNLESVTIPASVLVIETAAFAGCTGLKEVIFEENSELMSMPQNGFANTAITELIVPESVDSVQSYAFVVSPTLERIIFTGDAPNIFNDAFLNGWLNIC